MLGSMRQRERPASLRLASVNRLCSCCTAVVRTRIPAPPPAGDRVSSTQSDLEQTDEIIDDAGSWVAKVLKLILGQTSRSGIAGPIFQGGEVELVDVIVGAERAARVSKREDRLILLQRPFASLVRPAEAANEDDRIGSLDRATPGFIVRSTAYQATCGKIGRGAFLHDLLE